MLTYPSLEGTKMNGRVLEQLPLVQTLCAQ